MNDKIDEEIDQPVIVSGLLSGVSIGTWQEDYHLTGRDYEHLRNGKPITFNWANSILLTSVGIGLTLFGKYISQQTNPSVIIYKGEWIGFGIGVGISIILYLIGFCLPDDRKKLMKKLKVHFGNSPKMRQVMKEGGE